MTLKRIFVCMLAFTMALSGFGMNVHAADAQVVDATLTNLVFAEIDLSEIYSDYQKLVALAMCVLIDCICGDIDVDGEDYTESKPVIAFKFDDDIGFAYTCDSYVFVAYVHELDSQFYVVSGRLSTSEYEMAYTAISETYSSVKTISTADQKTMLQALADALED